MLNIARDEHDIPFIVVNGTKRPLNCPPKTGTSPVPVFAKPCIEQARWLECSLRAKGIPVSDSEHWIYSALKTAIAHTRRPGIARMHYKGLGKSVEYLRHDNGLDAYQLANWLQIGSAIQYGMIGLFGLDIGRDFHPGPNGLMPDQRGASGRHVFVGIGLKHVGRKWWVEIQGTWGKTWGNDGYAYLPESYFPDGGDYWAIDVPE